MEVDVSGFNHMARPVTEIYTEMKEASLDPVIQWIAEKPEDFEEEYRKATEWLHLYNEWATSVQFKTHNVTSFGIAINSFRDRNCGIVKKNPKNVSMLEIPRQKVLDWMQREGLGGV
jgi:hypothetical protein